MIRLQVMADSPPEVKPLPLCKDCVHQGTNGSGDATKFKCFAPKNFRGIDVVTGDKTYFHPTCYEARAQDAFRHDPIDYCGRAGQWFEAKPKPEDKGNSLLSELERL